MNDPALKERNAFSGSALRFVDEHGRPVRRTKYTHPYSYDGFVIWKSKDYAEARPDSTTYSDRLLQWDFDKHDRLCEKHFGNRGQRWANRDPKLIQAFLRDFHDLPNLELKLVMEYCNQSTGYPCWRFDFVCGARNGDSVDTPEGSLPSLK